VLTASFDYVSPLFPGALNISLPVGKGVLTDMGRMRSDAGVGESVHPDVGEGLVRQIGPATLVIHMLQP
jgi:hypothetical protein